MNKVMVNIWGRDFELPVHYQVYPGEEVTDNQRSALEDVHFVDYYEAQPEIRDYIQRYFSAELNNQSMENLFRFVIPKSIYIPRLPETKRFAIMCDFKFDMEHGIGMEFEEKRFRMAGAQDWIL